QVSIGHGLVATDEVKILTSGYSVYGEVTSVTATTVTITTTTVLVGTFNTALDGKISKCAEGTFSGGDTFFRVRTMPYGLSTSVATRLIEDANYSDLYISRGYDYGRPNRIDKLAKEISRISTIYYSQIFIPETFINGLSTVYDDSFESYEASNGGIYKLHSEDQNLYVFQELKIGFIPVLQNVFTGTQGGTVVGSSEQVLSPTMQYYVGEFGIGKNPESFFVYGKSKYGVDVGRGTPWRLSVDGLTPIAQTAFMNNYFTDKCRTVINSPSKIKVYGVYDIKFKEYVIAFSSGTGVTAETLAFNEKENQWSSFYSYVPETMCSNGIDIISFKNGGLWKHNENAFQANFYGVQYQPEVWVTLNAEYSNVKVMQAVGLESEGVWTATITTPGGQETNLILEDFQFKEGMQYAPLWRDINTPNIIPPSLPLFEGDEMRDTTFLCKFKWNNATYNKLFAINLSYIISNLHR
ncbi:MAG TPA: hypothetical protein VEA37_07845, partial [Flavobacterium sp.]|nr:hypothetical protein [Flavobacterium sp.]